MEVRLSAEARVYALGVVNNWRADSRGMMKLVERLGSALDLGDAERAACEFRQAGKDEKGNPVYALNPAAVLTCELSAEDAQMLRRMIEPSQAATYTRRQAAVLAELEQALGELA